MSSSESEDDDDDDDDDDIDKTRDSSMDRTLSPSSPPAKSSWCVSPVIISLDNSPLATNSSASTHSVRSPSPHAHSSHSPRPSSRHPHLGLRSPMSQSSLSPRTPYPSVYGTLPPTTDNSSFPHPFTSEDLSRSSTLAQYSPSFLMSHNSLGFMHPNYYNRYSSMPELSQAFPFDRHDLPSPSDQLCPSSPPYSRSRSPTSHPPNLQPCPSPPIYSSQTPSPTPHAPKLQNEHSSLYQLCPPSPKYSRSTSRAPNLHNQSLPCHSPIYSSRSPSPASNAPNLNNQHSALYTTHSSRSSLASPSEHFPPSAHQLQEHMTSMVSGRELPGSFNIPAVPLTSDQDYGLLSSHHLYQM